jgi:hypothetical protein
MFHVENSVLAVSGNLIYVEEKLKVWVRLAIPCHRVKIT